MTSVTQAAPNFSGSRIVSYLLDPNGNKARATWADGYYVTYGFDQLSRVTTATENGTFLLATYIYDALSRRTSLVYGNGTAQGYTYTTQGDMLTQSSTLSGTSNTYTNTFTKAHQIASEDSSNAAWRFVPTLFQTTAYTAANNLNQYVNITVGANPSVTMAYDGNGNLTGDGVWTFAYDAKNMLRTATKAGMSASYAYDPLGRRQAKTVNAAVTTFLADGDEEIADYSGTTVLRRYVPGPGTDMPIAVVTPGAPATRAYFHTNRQGSTVAMSNDVGTLAEGPYTYDAYGNGPPMTGVAFKYTGRRLDAETGLYYYRARYYSPNLGRFLQTDPVEYNDQMNLYSYVGNDPTNNLDPRGRATLAIGPVYTWNVFGGGVGVAVSVWDPWTGGDFDVGVYSTEELTASIGNSAYEVRGSGELQIGLYAGGVRDLKGGSLDFGVMLPLPTNPLISAGVDTNKDENGQLNGWTLRAGRGFDLEASATFSHTQTYSVQELVQDVSEGFAESFQKWWDSNAPVGAAETPPTQYFVDSKLYLVDPESRTRRWR